VTALLEFDGVGRVHGSGSTAVHALTGVSFRVEPGELVAVMGPSGSGKSTLLNLAGGLDTPTSGRVLVNGFDIGGASQEKRAELRRRSIGFVFQDYNLVSSLTARENVALPLELDGAPAHQAAQAAQDLLDAIDLGERADAFPGALSGGQRQRLAIARGLIGSRTLLLADEPTGALDSELGEQVIRLLRSRVGAREGGLLVTHDARYAAWADRTIFLADGKVVGATAHLDVDPGSLITADRPPQ